MKNITILSSCALLVLSACGGGGGTSSSVTATDSSQDSVGTATSNASVTQRFNALNTNYDVIGTGLVAQTTVPTSGSAIFTGQMGMDVSGALAGDAGNVDASLVGDLSLTANFANRSVSGSATNFAYADVDGNVDTSVSGSLAISGSPTNNVGITTDSSTGSALLAAVGEGALTIDQGATARTVNMDTILVGQFGKATGASNSQAPVAVRGFVAGRGSGDLSLTVRNGRFAAETANAGVFP